MTSLPVSCPLLDCRGSEYDVTVTTGKYDDVALDNLFKKSGLYDKLDDHGQ